MTPEQETFTALYRETYSTIYGYIYRRVPPEDVADLVAETYLTAWRRRRLLPVEPLRWLLVTARNVVMTARRRAGTRAAIEAAVLRARTDGVEDPDVTDRIALWTALARLGDRDREVLMLTCWDGVTAREGAAVLGCSVSAFQMRLHRARQRLETELAGVEVDVEKGEAHERATR
ncbi:siderophore-interacting protein [Longimycelium tulufanense]|uniref:Siderophore-interacting protein n=1 Tax=Longimycelium tulufanense TaxID=907463 RepID=A0A8J3CKQ4_9PSEU|nr:sigma-70 family RNA polymerase sigma factor [Longimycelium tulufanense]GGM81651.1 siderophore-interacting protein [Longimycelium tulufanense]